MSTGTSEILEALSVPSGTESVLERFDAVVRACPTAPAVSAAGCAYTFAEVDALSDALAARLRERLPADDLPVAMFVDHSAQAVVGLFGVMKAGRVLVTLDSHLPAERLRRIVELSGATCCLVDPGHASSVGVLGPTISAVLRLDELLAEVQTAERPSAIPAPRVGAAPVGRGRDQPLCVVFTSGSSGQPKGVVYTHGQALNDAYAGRLHYGLTADDRIAQVLPLSFAAGFALLMMALLNGAGVWCYDPRDRGVRDLERWIADERLSTFHCSPHLLRSLIASLEPKSVLTTLRLVSTVGEAVYGRDYEALRPHLLPHAVFVNWTGSSEIGCLSFHEVREGDLVPGGSLPAGLPVPNKQVLILREDGSRAEAGEAGELVVVSDYLSGGYWNDEGANAERFGAAADGRRLCRQGDLARVDAQGVLHLLGRQDAAVKIRGYLVDPSEVEAAVLASDAVQEAAIIAVSHPPDPTYLVAYVAPDPRVRTESVGALRRRLRERLPEYMVPSTVVQLTSLPRNERGKVDRQMLPPPVAAATSAPPTTQWEIVMADLWADVLGLPFVGLDDDFMSLGGDSLAVEEMLTSVAERFSVALVTTDLIEAPTLREFTRRVTLGSASLPSHPNVVTLRTGGTRPPLFCFAGGGALALSFLPLSRHFDDRSVYGFQANGLEKRALPDRTVEAAAQRSLEMMRVLQPRGPYALLGHSFGGLVALEVARRLTEAGEAVELLGLLDTYQPRSAKVMPPGMVEATVTRAAAHSLPGRLGRTVYAGTRRVLPDGLPEPELWPRRARARLAGVVPFSGQRQFDAFFDNAMIVGHRYRLRPYNGPTLLVMAENNPDGVEAWLPYLTGPTNVLDLPAEHSSLLREPYATQVARVVEAGLGSTAR